VMRAALCCRSRAMRYARSWAWVRCRVGIINPRLACAGPDDSGRTSWPVGVASAGKNRAPPGLVVYTCPEGAVQMTVPSGNWRSAQPPTPVVALALWGCMLQRQPAYVRLGEDSLAIVGVAVRRPGVRGTAYRTRPRAGAGPRGYCDSAGLLRCALAPVPLVVIVVVAAAQRRLNAVGNLGDDLFDVTAGRRDRIPHRRLARSAGGGRV